MNMSIPAFHVSDFSKVSGRGEVFIASRAGGGAAGTFNLDIAAGGIAFPAPDYPSGSLTIKCNLSDGAQGTFVSTSIDHINSYGADITSPASALSGNPTVFITGRCQGDIGTPAGVPQSRGLRYWVMIVNNKPSATAQGTSDIVGFAVHDNTGKRVAYGVGPLRIGDFTITGKPA